MAANETQEWLVDLLYDDEDFDTDETSARAGPMDLDDDKLAELEDFRSFLGEVRASLPQESLSEGVRASILDAARAEITKGVEEEVAADRRAPPSRKEARPRGSIWNRTKWSTIAQIASVATVLIVGAFSLQIFNNHNEPPSAHLGESPMATRAPQAAPTALAAKTPKTAPAEDDFPERKNAAIGGAPGAAKGAEDPTKTVAMQLSKKQLSREEELERMAQTATSKRAVPRAAKRSARRTKKKRTRSSGGPADLLGGMGSAQGDKKAERSKARGGYGYRPQRSTRTDSTMGKEFAVSQAPERGASTGSTKNVWSAPRKANAPTAKPKPKPTPRNDIAPEPNIAPRQYDGPNRTLANKDANKKADVMADSTTTPAIKKPAVKRAAPATTAPTSAAAAGNAPPAVNLSKVERAYRSGRYGDALESADSYLRLGVGSVNDQARAMELKAMALSRLGRTTESSRVYRELEKKYPSYAKKKGLYKKPLKKRRKSMSRPRSVDSLESFQ